MNIQQQPIPTTLGDAIQSYRKGDLYANENSLGEHEILSDGFFLGLWNGTLCCFAWGSEAKSYGLTNFSANSLDEVIEQVHKELLIAKQD